MATVEEKIRFIAGLGGVADADQRARARREQRDEEVRTLMDKELPMSVRDELRKAMSFEVQRRDGKGGVKSMDERGQAESIESEDASQKYRALDPEDYAKVQAALDRILKIKEALLAKKDDQGQPLFDKADLMNELFTPLVREGLMPENLVIDEHSETAKLLKNAYKSYLKMLEEARKERLEKASKVQIDEFGAAGGLAKAKAKGQLLKGYVDHRLMSIGRQVGLTGDETKRLAKIGLTGAKMLRQLEKVSKAPQDLIDTVNQTPGTTPRPPDEKQLTKGSAKVLMKTGRGVYGLAKAIKKRVDTGKSGDKKDLKAALKQAAEAAGLRMDAGLSKALAQALATACPNAASSLDGRLSAALDTGAMAGAVRQGNQSATVVEAVAAAVTAALGGLVAKPEAAVKALKGAAAQIGRSLRANGALANAFAEHLDVTPGEAARLYEPFVTALLEAAGEAFANESFAQAMAGTDEDLKRAARLNQEQAKRLQEQHKVDDRQEAPSEDEPLEEEDIALAIDLVQRAAFEAVVAIDATLADELMAVCPASQGALAGRLAGAVKSAALAEAVLSDSPSVQTIVEAIGGAALTALTSLSAEEKAAPLLKQAGEQFRQTLGSAVQAPAFLKAVSELDEQLDEVFAPFVAAALPAAKAACGIEGLGEALEGVKDDLGKAAAANMMDLVDQQAALEEETEAFERQLVLIDEAGETMAKQRSMAQLIAQLEQDQADLQIVTKVGALLGGMGMSVTRLGVDASNHQQGTVVDTVATEVGQSLVPALKAAQLVMQMSVTVMQIAQRATLVGKFEADVVKARKAGSPLLPAISNFYGAKVMQQTFAKVELALQTVQLAGSICSSVPEPITMGVGRLITAVGRASATAKKLTEQIYNHTQLAKGWKLTLEALNNPANRRAGLEALRINGTLAVHAVAWAAMENNDPIAREILRSCGVNEQTLADSESDQKTVIAYLETRLYEDLEFKDRQKIDTHWVPQPLTLSYPVWFALKRRAATLATPKLGSTATKDIDTHLRQLDLQPTIQAIRDELGAHTTQTLTGWMQEAQRVRQSLLAYEPKTADNSEHAEMADVCVRLADIAGARVREFQKLIQERHQLLEQHQQQQETRVRPNRGGSTPRPVRTEQPQKN